ncbi:hypothetical protein KIH13_17415 [Pseudomonas viridiflava]|nr:hypothetical protein KIH13_17415 [Pseudomonas viridiflava]
MEEYSPKHLNAKIFYRPIEVAVRWCGLEECESQILREASSSVYQPEKHAVPACIQEKLDILWDAILHGELIYGYYGITTASGACIDPSLTTIRHVDLKSWFIKFYPLEKPNFLFSTQERNHPHNSDIDLVNTLTTENNALKTLYKHAKDRSEKLELEVQALRRDNTKLTNLVHQNKKPKARNERAYLQLIGTLVNLFLSKTPSGKPYSLFTSQASIISALMAHNRNKVGFSQRTLEEKFAAARRSIDDSG